MIAKKKQRLELITLDLGTLIIESRILADREERKLYSQRMKLAERDLSAEKFLSRQKGGLKRYNERRQMHVDLEQMPEKDLVREAIEIVEPTEHFLN